MPLKILFVFTPTMDAHDRFFNCAPGSLLHAIAPLVAEIDAGCLDMTYVPFVYHPKNVDDRTEPDFLDIIERERVDVLAMSSTYDSWHVALRLSKLARAANPEIVTIHGGPHLDEVLEAWVLQRMPHLQPFSETSPGREAVDFAVSGDGEYGLLEIARHLARGDAGEAKAALAQDGLDCPGRGAVSFVLDDELHVLRYANPLDLDAVPFVPRHLLSAASLYDFACFRDGRGRRLETVNMVTHRGCKARCSFCSEGLPYQQRSLARIVEEARRAKALGAKAIFIDNSTVQDDPDHLRLFAELSRLGFEIGALTRFDLLQDPAQVAELRRCGCTYLYASIEQYDDGALDLMRKGQHTAQIDRAIDNLRRAGIRLGVSTLFGLPGETAESVSATLDYTQRRVRDGAIAYVSMSLFSFHPRTPLGQKMRHLVGELDFDSGPPNLRYPYTGFEEGSWYHPAQVTDDYAEDILLRANAGFGAHLVRNIGLHRGETAAQFERLRA